METGDLIRVMKQVQQVKKKKIDVLKPDTTEFTSITVAVYLAVSLSTDSFKSATQNGADISVLGYKMQRWASAPLRHDALNIRGFLLS